LGFTAFQDYDATADDSQDRRLDSSRLLKKRSIASRQRTLDVRLRSSIFRAPRLWIFLSSLQEAFLATC
jgi:hypothetical protein